MNKHLILGKGNLGWALKEQFGDEARFFPERISSAGPNMASQPEEFIWCAIGGGSVGSDPVRLMHTHLEIPLHLAQSKRPDQKLILFSSDYAERQGLSHYAMSKYFMELAVAGRFKNVSCYRVSSIYGHHVPYKTFPAKILAKVFGQQEITLSKNEVFPTPASWIARRAWEHVEMGKDQAYILPSMPIAAHQWAELVLMSARAVDPSIFEKHGIPRINPEYVIDENRPVIIQGRSTYPGWDAEWNDPVALWKSHGPKLVELIIRGHGA